MTAHAPTRSSLIGSSGERFLFTLAFLIIVVWGFSGSWEFPPEPERPKRAPVVSAARSDAEGSLSFSPELAAQGEQLFQANGCYACHSIQGDRKIGPNLLAIFGENVDLADGTSTVIDDAYLQESILAPKAKLVAGFEEAAMPSYDGLVSESDAEALAEYIKSLN